jgi:hypothetical protein
MWNTAMSTLKSLKEQETLNNKDLNNIEKGTLERRLLSYSSRRALFTNAEPRRIKHLACLA